jgi:type IV fimbrial biogenesis protein FimT
MVPMITSRSRMRGVSLIEVVITVSVVSIAIGLAVPSWDQINQKRQVTGAAENLASFMSDMQSSAIRRNERLTIALQHAGTDEWCVGAVLGDTPCDCRVTDPASSSYCSIDGSARIVASGDNSLAGMISHSADTAFTYEPVRGLMSNPDLATTHFFNLRSADQRYSLQVNVLPTGYIRICSNDSGKRVPGYFDCAAVETEAGET